MIYKEITGRLGNQMFQYATILAYKEKYKLSDKIILDFSKLKLLGSEEEGFCNQLKYFNVDDYDEKKIKYNFNIIWHKIMINYILKNNEIKIHNYEIKKQKKLNKNGIFYMSYGYYDFPNTKKEDKYFFGDFESSQYFNNIKEKLLKKFTPKYDILKKNKKLYDVINKENSVCISIRRGDFVNDNFIKVKHYVCNEIYYYKAIDIIKEKIKNPVFIIFSDDIEWCKKNMNFPPNTLFEDGNDPVWEKLRLMYSCKNFIISNSTFSWWAQYLSRNQKKIVIAPNKWKNYIYNKNGVFDIYEKDWILISNE